MSVSIGILSCAGAPLLGRLLAALDERGLPVTAVIMDARGMPAKNATLFAERTAGRLPPVDPAPFRDAGVPFHTVDDHNDATAVALVRELGIDVLFSQATPRILKGDILAAAPVGVVNVHPGLLPEYRGATCVEWAIHDDAPVGLTAHLMSAEIDAGAIIRRRVLDVRPDDTYTDIRVRVYRESVALQAEIAADLWAGAIGPGDFTPQPEGTFHRPIDDARMAEVMRKIESGAYARARAAGAAREQEHEHASRS